MCCLLTFGLILALSALVYRLLKRPHSYWPKRGVPQGKPVFILGDISRLLFRRESPPEAVVRFRNTKHEPRYVGRYQFFTPFLVIRDPDLIKLITVKDFDHFEDRRRLVTPEEDPASGKNLLNLTGQEWREMRNILSPSFTANKMKFMFPLISQSGERFVKHFLKKGDLVTVELKDIVTKFTIDAIGNTVFGTECDSFEDPDNEFHLRVKEATDFSSIKKFLILLGYNIAPKFCKFFNLKFISDETWNYFKRIVKENIESREQQGIVRPDMISILMEARKHYEESDELEAGKSKKVITDEDITGEAFTFFFGGFETVATLICFMAHELAVNPEIQEKLTREIDEVREKCNGKITYEDVTAMKYINLVVTETLRKFPPNIATDRICTKPYTIKPKNPSEKPVKIDSNTIIMLPIFAMHRDPKYFPEPERFDPERFNEENKSKIPPCAYMPFGFGPRMCIGLRYALLTTKILFYHLLLHFEIVVVEKTQIPIRFKKAMINLQAENGFWVGLKRRQQ